MRILNTSNDASVSEEELSLRPANKAPERVINAEIEKEMRDNFSFSTNMAYAPRRSSGKGSFRPSRGYRGSHNPSESRNRGGPYRPRPTHLADSYEEDELERGSKTKRKVQHEYRAPSPPPGRRAYTPPPLPGLRQAENGGKHCRIRSKK